MKETHKKPRRFQRSAARNSVVPAGLGRRTDLKEGVRLNKYLAHSGVATRRAAGDLVKAGKVKVNGAVLDNPAYSVVEGDVVEFDGRRVAPTERLVYLLLNKPKGVDTAEEHGTTVKDLFGEEDLSGLALSPIGTFDAATTGLLLVTNDGDLMDRLTDPRHAPANIYEAVLDRPFREEDTERLRGNIAFDWARSAGAQYPETVSLKVRTDDAESIRQAIYDLNYTVKKLDRTGLAGLTKKHLPRGFYRFLGEEEVRRLKYFQA